VDADLISTISALRFLGVPVESHATLGSTNDEAFRRAREGAPEGLVVTAEHQTAGRGRLGRSWFDGAGRSLMFSALLRPTIPLPSYPLFALALASAVSDAGGELVGRPLVVKWPNDVLYDGKKVCGVLAESRSLSPGEPPALVLGAGVNVNLLEEDFPPEFRARATSLRIAAEGREVPIASLLAGILSRFERDLEAARGADPAALFARVRPRLPERGARVRVAVVDRVVEGELLDVTPTGALEVRDTATGRVETLAAGVME
jgi:BirA family biotin operon repressor/biotin-[acetyl-CoA-carboxylase] ligase